MANQTDCETFNDVHETPRPNAPPPEVEAIKKRNAQNAHLYYAVKKVLESDFNIKSMPPEPTRFPGGLKGKDLAQVSAILGILHADNWQDPSNGKTVPNPDDMLSDDQKVIDRRFVDAVVDAVKEYTSSSMLFNKIFELMIAEAGQGVPPAPNPKS